MVPLKPADLFVLLVLADGDRHGYGIMKDVERQSEGAVTLELGSLYRLIARLMDEGHLEDAPARAGSSDEDARRRYYRLTKAGRSALRLELQRLRSVIELGRTKGLVGRADGRT
ncbi:MAG: helix-turn-helix transcriptional regulator [Vicinamibacterales bacterium]